jgi:hypothetical protein
MKQVFFTLALIGLASCGQDECCDHKHNIVVKGRQYDFTQDSCTHIGPVFVSDSVFLNNQAYIDSLTTVSELLDHLETLPAE